jgi:MFS family permease
MDGAVTIEFDEDVRLLKNPRFRRLLEARLAGQTAQNALLYALLILLVKESGSSIHSTLLIVAFTIPAIILGIPAGTTADILPRRLSMTIGYVLRAATAAALFYYSDSLFYIYLFVLVHASIGQISGPAEAATVPAVVRRDQLPAANSLMMLVLVFGQIVGMVVIAPLLIKLISADSVFVVSAVLFVVAGYIVGWLASGLSGPPAEKGPTMGFVAATREGFRILRTNRRAYLSMVYLVTAVALSRVLVILLPKYTRDVLQIAPEDTVFIAAPAAIGAGLGLVLVPLLSRLFGAWRVVAFGFAMLLLGLAGLGLVVVVRNFLLENVDLGIGFVEREVGVSSVISVTMLLAIPLGFAFTLVTVASRVVMNEGAPQEAQGRIFAVTQAIGDTLSLLPLLLVGVIGELVGVRATLLASTVAAIAATGYLTFSKRFGPRVGPAGEPAPQPGSA